MRRVVLILGLLIAFAVQAQRQYWGTTFPSGPLAGSPVPFGSIVRFDSLGLHAGIVLAFDTTGTRAVPVSGAGLLAASNGLIYYLAQEQDAPFLTEIMSYDPVLDSSSVCATLGLAGFPWKGQRGSSQMIEGLNGELFDITGFLTNAAAFRFNSTTNAVSPIALIPTGVDSNGNPHFPTLTGGLTRASNGRIYGGETPWPLSLGKVGRIDPLSNTYTAFSVLSVEGGYPINGEMRQVGSKLYLTTNRGGIDADQSFSGWGAIGSFDINTNTYQKIIDLGPLVHNPSRGMVAHVNGLLYGEALGDTILVPGYTPPYHSSLFSFDPLTNTLERVVGSNEQGLDVSITGTALQPGLLAASNGRLYGSFKNGLFEYDPAADTLVLRAPLIFHPSDGSAPIGYGLQSPLVEICRKPNFKLRPTTSFNVCAGARFFYDLRNENATSVVWRRNGVVVPSQSNQRLEFDAIAETDEGVWSCTLTNTCGITEPPAITITVNAGSFTNTTITGDTLLCGASDTALLTGNIGGTWNTGTADPTLTVDRPGIYFVQHQQACGISQSNTLHIAYSDSAVAPEVLFNGSQTEVIELCPQDLPLTVEGNDAGPWNDGPTGQWQDGSTAASFVVEETGDIYITASNACNSDTSVIVNVRFYEGPPSPQVSITDLPFGNTVDTYLCSDEFLYLNSTQQDYYTLFLNGAFVGSLGGGVFSQPYRVDTAGVYEVLRTACGLTLDTLTITVYEDTAPPVASILPDLDLITGCEQDTVYLSSSSPNAYWTWFDAFANLQVDTAQTIPIDWNSTSYAMTPFNGCGEGPQDFITIDGIPAPDVQFNTASDTLCLSDGSITLNEGTPPGGTYAGPGVIGNSFNPAAAGIGEHTITYSYSDGNCTGFAQDVIAVDVCQRLASTGAEEGLRIMPNPTTGWCSLMLGPITGSALISIHDATGAVVMRMSVNGPGPHALNMDGLAAGTYEVRAQGRNGSARGRLVLLGQ
jgi:hypothetical protein